MPRLRAAGNFSGALLGTLLASCSHAAPSPGPSNHPSNLPAKPALSTPIRNACEALRADLARIMARHEQNEAELNARGELRADKLLKDRLDWELREGTSAVAQAPASTTFIPPLPLRRIPPQQSDVQKPRLQAAQGQDPYNCQNTLYSSFDVGQGTALEFTTGSSPTFCSVPPWLIWKDNTQPRRGVFAEFSGWNIDSLWCAGSYAILGLAGATEGGSDKLGLGFWNLETGKTRAIATLVREQSPGEDLSEIMQSVRKAPAAQVGDAIVFKLVDGPKPAELRFWPRRKEWQVVRSK